MIMTSKHDQEIETESIRAGQIDAVMASEANLVDEVLLSMHEKGAGQDREGGKPMVKASQPEAERTEDRAC